MSNRIGIGCVSYGFKTVFYHFVDDEENKDCYLLLPFLILENLLLLQCFGFNCVGVEKTTGTDTFEASCASVISLITQTIPECLKFALSY